MAKLIICVDGLGYDLISKKNTPFLYGLKRSRLKTLFAFTGLEYGFFTGKNPSESGVWLEFCRSNNSIFKSKILRKIPLRNYYAIFLQIIHKRGYLCSLHNIPKNKVKYFDTSARRGVWSLDYFKNKKYVVYKWPFFVVDGKKKLVFNYEDDYERLRRLIKVKGKDVYYTQLMGIDKVIHRFGKKSMEAERALKKMDALLSKVAERFDDFVIWGDHGFADVKEYIDLEKMLPRRRDYLYFIAGTTASFWFNNDEAKEEVLKVLKDGKILTEELAKKYNIPFSKSYGDLVYFVEKGKYFFPNFYQRNLHERFGAMHGYPDNNELDGFLVCNKKIPKIVKISDVWRYL